MRGAYSNELINWIESLDYITTTDMVAENGKKQINQTIQAFPRTVDIPYEESFWLPHPEDSMRIQQWKRLQTIKQRIKKTGRLISNWFRTKPLMLQPLSHRFSFKLFCGVYLTVPLEQFLAKERSEYLMMIIQQLDHLHKLTQQLNSRFLFFDHWTPVWEQQQFNLIETAIQENSASWEILTSLRSELDGYAKQHELRFQQWKQDTAQEFLRQWNFAGTFILPSHHFGIKQLKNLNDLQKKQCNEEKASWQNHFKGEIKDWTHDLSLNRIQLTGGIAYYQAKFHIEDKILVHLDTAFLEAIQTLQNSVEHFQQAGSEAERTLKHKLLTETHTLLTTLRNTILPDIIDALTEIQFDQVALKYQEYIQQTVNHLPEKHIVFQKRDTTSIPPQSEIQEIPIKDLFEEYIFHNLTKQLQTSQIDLQQDLLSMIYGVAEIDQIVEFNLEAALTLLEEEDNVTREVQQAAQEGLERVVGKIQDYQEQLRNIQAQANRNLLNTTWTFTTSIQELLNSEKLIALKLKLASAKAKEQVVQARQQIWDSARNLLPRFWKWQIKQISEWNQRYLQIRQMTGLASISDDAPERLNQFLQESQQRIDALPFIYRRLFSVTPLEDDRFFLGRNEEMSMLRKEFENWQQDKYTVTAIIGERGSGHTTLLNMAEKRIFKDHRQHRIDFNKSVIHPKQFFNHFQNVLPDTVPTNFKELEDTLLNLSEPQIYLVENLQYLFFKTVDGFDLLEQFLLVISHTHKKVYWVVTCKQYSWNYLEKAMGLQKYFSRIIPLKGIKQEDLENALLKRHRATGYRLLFEIPKKIVDNRQFKKLESVKEQQAFVQNLFFEQLQNFASGNIAVAILFWLRSIIKIENYDLILNPVIDLETLFLHQLSTEEVFTLGCMVQHDHLNPQQHSIIFRQNLHQSTLFFNQLSSKGFIIKTPSGYQIHPFLYRPIVQALKRKNILH